MGRGLLRDARFASRPIPTSTENTTLPNWNELLDESRSAGSTFDVIRRKYLRELYELTGRNVIVYYSGWLQKGGTCMPFPCSISDADKNGFMAAIHKLDRSKGLDLILHTPGGDLAATESLVDYLRSMFGTDIRAIVPQIALSGGTLMTLACKQIVMGKHSSLGPIDPQFSGLAAHGILEEFKQASDDIAANRGGQWLPVLAKYSPTLIGDCDKAMKWTVKLAREWLVSGMFKSRGKGEATAAANRVIKELADHALTLSHARHISLDSAKRIGLEVLELETDDSLQEAVLTVHHACIQTLSGTPACKIVENHLGIAFIQSGPN